ncbi:unnamed protein product [Notodromas monacha]|uniref:Uncharacterized protein n=1 Tax=Notodromas monacha TaxID=399045 RepID=A0A7R9GIC3_9CRUS|nr:unnamed protein product [Notodromas monacha]CAG0922444.1 unnamed protein product [Notodromas monacha]
MERCKTLAADPDSDRLQWLRCLHCFLHKRPAAEILKKTEVGVFIMAKVTVLDEEWLVDSPLMNMWIRTSRYGFDGCQCHGYKFRPLQHLRRIEERRLCCVEISHGPSLMSALRERPGSSRAVQLIRFEVSKKQLLCIWMHHVQLCVLHKYNKIAMAFVHFCASPHSN